MSTETNEFPGRRKGDRDRHVLDLLGAYALGALDPDETERVVRHVQRCETCRAELAAYEEVAGLLAYASPAQQVPVRARASLLSRIDEIGTPNREQMIILSEPAPARRKRPWPPVAAWPRVAAFATLPLVVVLAVIAVMAGIISDKQQEIEEIQAEQDTVTRFVAKAAATPNSDTPFTASNVGGDVHGRLLIDWEMNQMMILVVDLPPLGEEQQYVAWLRIRDTDEYAREAPLDVDDEGRAQVIISPKDSISSYEAAIITIEASSDSSAPAGPLVMSTSIPRER